MIPVKYDFIAAFLFLSTERPWYANKAGWDCNAATMWNRYKANEVARRHNAR